jgi:hypothetical protein
MQRLVGVDAADAAVDEPRFVIEEVTDPDEIERFRAHDEAFRRNSDWLEVHWEDVLPQARGRFLAVAGQEPFIADSPEHAAALARAAHPDDIGLLLQYVRPALGPRIYGPRVYAHRR